MHLLKNYYLWTHSGPTPSPSVMVVMPRGKQILEGLKKSLGINSQRKEWEHVEGTPCRHQHQWKRRGRMIFRSQSRLVVKTEERQLCPRSLWLYFFLPCPAEEGRDKFSEHLTSSHAQPITGSYFLHQWHDYCIQCVCPDCKKTAKSSAKYWGVFKHIYKKH